jgi:hypothetical protein
MTQTTKVAPRTVNRNFAYDDEAYHEVKRNLGRLMDAGQLRPAMQLALGLMEQGSYQVEMSDEGLMAQDIEDCLSVVLKALEKCDLPANEVIAWCSAILRSRFTEEMTTGLAPARSSVVSRPVRHDRLRQFSSRQVHAVQTRATQVGLCQIGIRQVRTGEIYISKIGFGQVGPGQHRTHQDRSGQVGIRQIGAYENDTD